jgi:hypothetical protein
MANITILCIKIPSIMILSIITLRTTEHSKQNDTQHATIIITQNTMILSIMILSIMLLSMMLLSIMILSIKILGIMILSIMILSIMMLSMMSLITMNTNIYYYL